MTQLKRPIEILAIAGVICFALANPGFTQSKNDKAINHGKALAEVNCARCHETGLSGESPMKKAPPFWKMFSRRSVDTIADMLLTKSGPQHSEMPNFTITAKQSQDIAAWIAWVQPIAHGKRLVEENCGSCHATGRDDESEHKQAPPFRNLSMFYPIEALEEAFAEGIETGHPDMPVFQVSITQLQDILSYVQSIQKPEE